MALLDLTSQRIWSGGQEIKELWVNNLHWQRPFFIEVSVGGQITQFVREGVEYTQVVFRQNGTLSFSDPIEVDFALGGAGASSANAWNRAGGGGGEAIVERAFVMPYGSLGIRIGAGGIQGAITGSPSELVGIVSCIALGGGRGAGGTAVAGTGANGGGGSQSQPPGIGTNFTGGLANATRSGGGAGAGGPGFDAVGLYGGNGGPGIMIDWMDPPTGVCGGGGGTSDRTGDEYQGVATHGGTNGVNAGTSQDADWGGGAGGVRNYGTGNAPGKGGDGFFVIRFPSKNTITEFAA